MTPAGREPEVLGILLVVQNALCSLTGLDGAGALVERALRRVPGVEGARVVLHADASGSPEMRASQAARTITMGETPKPPPRVIPIATLRRRFGHVAIDLADEAAFDPYEPFVRNMTGTLALLLENRDQRRELESELVRREDLVAERTVALRASNIKRDLALEAAKLGEWDLDLSKRRAQTNVRHDLIFGYDRRIGDWTYEMFLNHVDPEDRPRVEALVERTLRDGDDFGADFRIRGADGALRWVSACGTLVGDPGASSSHFLGLLQDVTDAKREAQEREALLAREQDARRKVEEALRVKDEFLTIVSHELRTPLTAVLGWAQALLNTRSNAPADVQRGLRVIERNAQAQARLVEDILDISRVVTGKLRIDLEAVCLRALLNEMLEIVGPSMAAKRLSLGYQGVDEPCLVLGDPQRLKQVVWNLLSNATKFTPHGGRIDVSLRLEGGEVSLSVRDTGIGIAKESLPHVFERFWQADGSATRAYGGLGLGLAIVRHLMELHGGGLEVESEGLGRGAIFTIRLAAYRRDAAVLLDR